MSAADRATAVTIIGVEIPDIDVVVEHELEGLNAKLQVCRPRPQGCDSWTKWKSDDFVTPLYNDDDGYILVRVEPRMKDLPEADRGTRLWKLCTKTLCWSRHSGSKEVQEEGSNAESNSIAGL